MIPAVRLVLIERCIARVESRCDRQAALVADLMARGGDTGDAKAVLVELERALVLLEATQARLRAERR